MLAGSSTLVRISLTSSSVPNQTSCVWLPDRNCIFPAWMTYHISQCLNTCFFSQTGVLKERPDQHITVRKEPAGFCYEVAGACHLVLAHGVL